MKKKDEININDMVSYQNRMVDKDSFRAYVYGKDDAKKLANSWDEHKELIASGIWFSEKPVAEKKKA